MNRNHLMILNAGSTYCRLLLTAGLGLTASRWILDALGETDFGLFSVIGGIMGFLTFINVSMAGSAQRHFAFAIGNDCLKTVHEWFNSAILVHFLLAGLIFIVGLPIGIYLIENVLNIPADRISDCKTVLLYVLIATVVSVISVPFVGMYTATQRISELAFFAILGSLLNFALAWFLLSWQGDRFLFYAFYLMLLNILIPLIQALRALISFKECRIKWQLLWNPERLKELLSFAGWTLFGVLGNLGRSHGIVLLTNYFFGARMNSALAISNQLAGQAEQVSQGLFGAMAPEITSSEGRGERERMIKLSLRASKFSVFLSLIILFPLISELDFILNIWLKNVPEFTQPLCLIVLLTFLVEKLTAGYMVAVSAYGKIAGYQSSLGGILLLTLPLAYVVAILGGNVVWVISTSLLTGTLCMIGRILWVKHLMQVPIRLWVYETFIPCIKVIFSVSVIAIALRIHRPETLWWQVSDLLILPVTVLLFVWFIGLDVTERIVIKNLMRKVLNKKK